MDRDKKNKIVDKKIQENLQRRIEFKDQQSPGLKYPFLQRNRTQSQVSYEGNTIDMVRIVRKNQQARRSRINIDRKEYQKYQNTISRQKINHRYSQSNSAQPYAQLQPRNSPGRYSSTYVHQGTGIGANDTKVIEHYIRPSNVNILPTSSQQPNNKVLGFTLLVVFLFLFSAQYIVCAYLLNVSHVVFQHYQFVKVMSGIYYEDQFGIQLGGFEYYNFLIVLTIYLITQCLFHLSIFGIDQYSQGAYKLIDKQTSKLEYILRCRDYKRSSHTLIQKITKKPYFTILLVILSTLLYSYGIIYCFYYSEFNYLYPTYLTNYVVLLIQLLYFAIILPEVIKYIFFERMHIVSLEKGRTSLDNSSQSAAQFRSEYFKTPLTVFNIQNWWTKLTLLVLFVSIFYSFFTSIWLIVICFARIEISFLKIKYRIDTFYLEAYTKFIFLLFCATGLLLREQYSNVLQFDYGIQCLILILFAIVLSRIIANTFIRVQLYKKFYSEMNINLAIIIFTFFEVYIISFSSYYFEFIHTSTVLIAIYCFFLMISIYSQGNHRLTITFDAKNNRKSDFYVEMGNF